MSSLIILVLVSIVLLVSLMSFLIYAVDAHYNYHFIQAQDDVIFLETFEDALKLVEIGNGTQTAPELDLEPIISDPNLKTEIVFKGLEFPTSMAFLGHDDILVLEKNNGTVRRVVNGNMQEEPLLDVKVGNKDERGMLGIALSQSEERGEGEPIIFVFLYYTETKTKDGEDLEKDGSVLGNRLYRYELVDNKLINPKLLLDLPAEPGAKRSGGAVLLGPDQNVYLAIGYVDRSTEASNVPRKEADGSGGVLRVTQDGKPVGKGIIGDTYPLNLYYAYGIRNSFGMDFDPLTGNLWDTENGPAFGDEINLVKPGFNSGWEKVQGIWKVNTSKRQVGIFQDADRGDGENKLVTFNGIGKYSSPEFAWNYTVGPSALKFLTTDKLGKQYMNDIFVGNVNDQNIYHFDLTKNRNKLLLNGTIADKISDTREELDDEIVFAKDLGRITDIDVGPDGNLYVLSHSWNRDNQYLRMGSIFKISKSVENGESGTSTEEPSIIANNTGTITTAPNVQFTKNSSAQCNLRY